MRKFYFVSCLMLGMMLGMGLTSCGDDDPVVDNDLTTPEQPGQPDEPDEPTTSSVMLSSISYYYSDDKFGCFGDSVSYFALVEKLVKAKQDSVANVNGTLVIELQSGERKISLYDKSDDESASNAFENLIIELLSLGEQAQGFVYTGGGYAESSSVTISGDGHWTSSGSSESRHYFKIRIPILAKSIWTTADTGSVINKISFEENPFSVCTINGNDDETFNYAYNGYDLTISQGTEEKCALLLNETGTKLRLVRLDGEEVTDGPVFTLAE